MNTRRPLRPFGTTTSGEEVVLHELVSPVDGAAVRLSTLGATIVGFDLPDRRGDLADVVLGFDDAAGYQSPCNAYFGATVGRVANRIAGGRFTLDGVDHDLVVNNGPNHLHGGGDRAFHNRVWDAAPIEDGDGPGVVFSLVSPDGDEGYPGTVRVEVTYVLASGELRIGYRATTDRATPVSLTNHAYFNLSGAGGPAVTDHILQVNASSFTPTDDTLIPTGEVAPVEGTALDFRAPTVIGARIAAVAATAAGGYDHNFVLDGRGTWPNSDPVIAAILDDPRSGRRLTVSTDSPGLQFYSGNHLDGVEGKAGQSYVARSGCCLEAQLVPDAINQQVFSSPVLRPGEQYRQKITYAWSTIDVPSG